MPTVLRFLRIQLPNVSFGVSETWFVAVHSRLREPTAGFCSGSLMQAQAGTTGTTRVLDSKRAVS